MQSAPLAGSNTPLPRSASPRKRSHEANEPRLLIVGCGILFVVGLAFALVMTAKSPLSIRPVNLAQIASETTGQNLGSAKVIIDASDGSGCRQRAFDNQTGRMVRSQQPCDSTTLDGSGAPVPVGTIHRLDAISKSFSGH
jgi:hypothetical protein